MNNYYIYIYLDPRKNGSFKYGSHEFKCEPFYVGKCCPKCANKSRSEKLKRINYERNK